MRKIFFLPSLPDGIHGINRKTDTGYIIAVNARMPIEQQAKTLRHEIAHITLGHFEQTARPLDDIEAEAAAW